MVPFMPNRVYIEPQALTYPLGQILDTFFSQEGIPVFYTGESNRVLGIPGKTPQEKFVEGKQTLVLSVKKQMHLESCKPSADYSFPLVTGCSGGCQYCYLQTRFGDKPYIRIYVNIDEILQAVKKVIEKNKPKTTTFEASASSDPLAVEHFTGSLARAIVFFGEQRYGRLRFVTKFTRVEPLLALPHNGHTRFRFSLNSDYVIRNFENHTPVLQERIEAASKVAGAGYPLGFILAPLMIYEGWREEYASLLKRLAAQPSLYHLDDLTFELIQFRFTQASKKTMLSRFPNTKLPLDEAQRRVKFGKYGMKKWIYTKEQEADIKGYLQTLLGKYFPNATIEYFT